MVTRLVLPKECMRYKKAGVNILLFIKVKIILGNKIYNFSNCHNKTR